MHTPTITHRTFRIQNFRTLLSALFLLTAFTSAAQWVRIAEKGFKAEFPVQPNHDSKKLKTEVGELTLDSYMYDASNDSADDNLVYLITTTEYPSTMMSSDDKEQLPAFFRGAIDGAVKNVGGKLMSEKDISLEGYPGRECDVDYNEGEAIIRMRCYLVKHRMFMVQTITAAGKAGNKSRIRFLDSFELKK